jgi:hypothetical protein
LDGGKGHTFLAGRADGEVEEVAPVRDAGLAEVALDDVSVVETARIFGV